MCVCVVECSVCVFVLLSVCTCVWVLCVGVLCVGVLCVGVLCVGVYVCVFEYVVMFVVTFYV